ncbi:hypothetical protein Bpfe_027475, partial [Biomphalaria pfeifferi]
AQIGIHIEQGTNYFYNFQTGQAQIAFKTPFRKPPTVILTMTVIEFDLKSGAKVDTYYENLTTTGFTLKIFSWLNTTVFKIRVQ